MPAKTRAADAPKVYDVLHDFHTLIDDETGEEGLFCADPDGHPTAALDPEHHGSAVFDPSKIRRPAADVERLTAQLLKGLDHHGPLIAERKADEQPPTADVPADSEGGK